MPDEAIMDGAGSKTMDIGSPEFQAMLQGQPVAQPDKTGEKSEPSPDSTKAGGEPSADKVEPETIEALKKELARVRAQVRGPREEVGELRERIANLEGQLAAKSAEPKQEQPPVKGWDDEKLNQQEVAWQSELAGAQAALALAQLHGDSGNTAQANERMLRARQELVTIRKEQRERDVARAEAQVATKQDADSAINTIAGLYADLSKAFPEVVDKSSALFKAAEVEFSAHRSLMAKLGPLGEAVAVQMAIAKNPALITKTSAATETRKQMLGEIEKAAESALTKGVSATPSKSAVDWSTYTSTSGKVQEFEDALTKIMSG